MYLVISPDASVVVYKGPDVSPFEPVLNMRPLDQLQGARLRGGEGGSGPFVSPDGEWVGFVQSAGRRLLQKVSISGGPAVTLTESPDEVWGASWGADDQIIFGSRDQGLFRVPGGGGEPEVLTTPDPDQDEVAHMWPSIIPDREAVVFVIVEGG